MTKRVFDIVGASLLLVAAIPLLLAIALVILADDGGPVLYRQERMGRGRRPFRIYKFRTVSCSAGTVLSPPVALANQAVGEAVRAIKLRTGAHLTRVGRWLRLTSLDELPQLLNVLRGEMSLVGPRPLQRFELTALNGHAESRLAVRPGITGLWQVGGRSTLSWDERIALDERYLRSRSLRGDAVILARTLPAVVRRRGAM